LPDISVGVATFDGAGGINRVKQGDYLPGYFVDENNGGTVSQPGSPGYNGTYNVDSSCGLITTPCGRVTVSLSPGPAPVWYLVAPGQAFEVGGVGDTSTTQGVLLPQSGYPFSLASILGSYSGGTQTPVVATVTNAVEQATTPPPGGIFALTFDINGPGQPAGGNPNLMYSPFYGLDPDTNGISSTTIGAAFGKFILIDPTSNQIVSVLYVAGSGSAGATGGKSGLVGLNVGATPDAPDPTNPRLTVYGR
jgi:hypothetical protein